MCITVTGPEIGGARICGELQISRAGASDFRSVSSAASSASAACYARGLLIAALIGIYPEEAVRGDFDWS